MHKDQITEALKNYRSYRYAVNQYERHRPHPQAGVANYDAMPSGSGAPELFFAPNARMGDMGHTSFQDRLDYQAYRTFISEVDGALDTLTDDEQSVLRLKWMEGVELRKIAERKGCSVNTITSTHKRALNKMAVCFRFLEVPQIEHIPTRPGSEHMHHREHRMRVDIL
jgi:RNA polymerase sigma factor (sigma-70 family)